MEALMIGCGKMGGALLNQWVKSDGVSYTVIDPANTSMPARVEKFVRPEELASRRFDMLIIAIKPQMVEVVLPQYAKHLKQTGCILSMAAGCSADRLSILLQNNAVIRIMPNLPSFIGKGVAGMFAAESVTDIQKTHVEAMMSLAGSALWVDNEDGIDRITAIAGSGPGYIFEVARVYVKAAQSLGFSKAQARALVLETIAGTIEMAKISEDSLETLRNNVTSKKGTTEAGLQALNSDNGLTERFEKTVKAAYVRAVELR